MKVILTHDVDHLYISEHWKDRFLLGLFFRSVKSLLMLELSLIGFFRRFKFRTHRIPELIEFNKSIGAPSNFYFGMANGLGLSYHPNRAKPIIRKLLDDDHFIGLHGISFDDKEQMLREKTRLEKIIGREVVGIRNHYLRQSENTKALMAEIGYQFDSTDRGLFNPKKEDGVLSIPISIMDVDVVKQAVSAEEALKSTLEILDKAIEKNLKYFVINFHDIYFDPMSYPNFYNWYLSVVKECQVRGFEFTDFNSVLQEQQS